MGRGDSASLVRICDFAGRHRGTGFVADHLGTVITGHETVDGLARVVVRACDERLCLAEADAIIPIAEAGIALVRTEGLGVAPLPVGVRRQIAPGRRLRLWADGWHTAHVLGRTGVVYTANDRFHLIDDALALTVDPGTGDALALGGTAAGSPLVDATTGAVVGLVGTALHGERTAPAYALPLPPLDLRAESPLGELLDRNATTVPCRGADLNFAAVLELTALSTRGPRCPDGWPDPLARPSVQAELDAVTRGVCALVGPPGSGRTTELTAWAARRAQGDRPAPTVWLRGADLWPDDRCIADAVARVLRGAAGDCGRPGPDEAAAPTTITPDRIAALARDAGRPLLVLLDGPEEMPPALARRLLHWTAATARWLDAHAVSLVVGCRPEFWEQAGALYPRHLLHHPERPAPALPPAIPLDPLTRVEADRIAEHYGLSEAVLAPGEEPSPLALRLLAEVRRALPRGASGRPTRTEVFRAHLDLQCARSAVRIAAFDRRPHHGPAVRRLAAQVSDRVHEAARRCLRPGQGELDRESFDELFPWRTGWAPAVLSEGLLVPTGGGYRFAHEGVADWLQGVHLDLDAALDALVDPWGTAPLALPAHPGPPMVPGHVPPPPGARQGPHVRAPALPVPHHRIGPVVQALLHRERERGPNALAECLVEVIEAVDRLDRAEPPGPPGRTDPEGRASGGSTWAPGAHHGSGRGERAVEARWWGVHLITETLLAVPDPAAHLLLLRALADHIAERSRHPPGTGAFASFGPAFWCGLRLSEADRLDLLRRLVPADPPARGGRPSFLDAVAARLAADPLLVQPLLCRWLTDRTPLAAGSLPGFDSSVAGAARTLLYDHRMLAPDDLMEALVASGHPGAHELLAALAAAEPSALSRAVDRWAHDPRPERRRAAATHAPVTAAHADTEAEGALLRYAASALLARPADEELRGPALAVLIRDPLTRSRHLARALDCWAAGVPGLSASALIPALTTHADQVFPVLGARLREADGDAGEVVRALAGLREHRPARRAAELVARYIRCRPEGADHAAAFVEHRLEDGPAARALLLPLVSEAIWEGPGEFRRALAPVVAAPGGVLSGPLRAELLEALLKEQGERSADPAVLDALLRTVARTATARTMARTRDLIHRTGGLYARTPHGDARWDRTVVELARERPEFALLVAACLARDPREWTGVLGPGARRAVGNLGGAMPMPTVRRGHGSLRPA
ncbi:serine protease [Streptomyces sp. NPDC056500]|uniref:serine protease n=1 Tax=Streptomyces sp. NPDC056500 TaxID=3345840 RepID=UPI003688E477